MKAKKLVGHLLMLLTMLALAAGADAKDIMFGGGQGFGENDEIRRELIADRERPVIRPRVVKNAAEQRRQMLHDNLRASAHKTDSYGILWSCSPVGEDT